MIEFTDAELYEIAAALVKLYQPPYDSVLTMKAAHLWDTLKSEKSRNPKEMVHAIVDHLIEKYPMESVL